MRHLHATNSPLTYCGRHRNAGRTVSVHATKARKTDCRRCCQMFRLRCGTVRAIVRATR